MDEHDHQPEPVVLDLGQQRGDRVTREIVAATIPAARAADAARARVALAARVFVCEPAQAAVDIRAPRDDPRVEPDAALLRLLAS